MAGDHGIGVVGLDDVHILAQTETGAVDDQRAGDAVVHDHVGRHVSPLVEQQPQSELDLSGPCVLAAERELVADVHLVPGDLVDPDHRAHRLQVVEPAPHLGLLAVHRQRSDPRLLLGQSTQNVTVIRDDLHQFFLQECWNHGGTENTERHKRI